MPQQATQLSPADLAVLQVLRRHSGRVVSRETLVRQAGLDSSSARRADVCLVALRRALGPASIVTVRQRGWMLTDAGVAASVNLLHDALDMTE